MNEIERMTVDFADALSHGMIVSKLAVLVARELGLDDEFCREIAIAGLLHDIGKLKLSEQLHLERERAMVVEKLKYVRMHAAFSRDILEAAGYDDNITGMVYHHHENNDGSGYPSNISGEDIPLGARIIRVCDVFAALTSDRSYRKSFSENVAVELMIEEAKHFDMKIFLAFMKVIHSKEYKRIDEIRNGPIEEMAERYMGENLNYFLYDDPFEDDV